MVVNEIWIWTRPARAHAQSSLTTQSCQHTLLSLSLEGVIQMPTFPLSSILIPKVVALVIDTLTLRSKRQIEHDSKSIKMLFFSHHHHFLLFRLVFNFLFPSFFFCYISYDFFNCLRTIMFFFHFISFFYFWFFQTKF